MKNLSAEPDLEVDPERQYFGDLDAVPAIIRDGAQEALASQGGAQ
ncbi:MAG: hypothetical protein AAGL10_05710 [Pseudomonadota bacterium]